MNYEYDVAFSFAGEDRAYVAQLVGMVRARGISVFYDDYETASLAGENLIQRLYHIYRDSARLCVIVVSSSYLNKDWTMHELKAAQDREFVEKYAYIIPIKLETGISLPGIPNTKGYLDAKNHSIGEIAYIIRDKVADLIEAERAKSEVSDNSAKEIDNWSPNFNSEKISDLPAKIHALIETILNHGDPQSFIAQFKEIESRLLSYGSQNAISLIADMHAANFRNEAHPDIADGNEIIALYILLLCQVKYDATGIKMTPQNWYKTHLGLDYFQKPESLNTVTNNIIRRLGLPPFLEIK